ncbi:hypothetical protein DL240_12195 [Lujinxingia litoralis]|uniref:Uncharacterized protein n=1 Tax=Lujinxingia litoralis TaxID=2211119 RepID=A0A328C5M8_9DELT|nr:LemA family protein [Lujinxingia litoralis]RAL21611.1 hypothetical protein DL240_12195 [Lujinxingia litoralis]
MRLLKCIASLVLALIGLYLLNLSFAQLQDARRISRMPLSKVQGALPGEVYLRGQVHQLEGTTLLRSTDTDTPSVYYHYEIEREETDSDGDTRWVTIHSEQRFIDFVLQDDTGPIRVHPHDGAPFSLPVSSMRTAGDKRYTERRLEPGHSVLVMGMAGYADEARLSVGFASPGSYVPIIARADQSSETHRRANLAVVSNGFGLVLLMISAFLFLGLFRAHNTTLFLITLSAGASIILIVMGLQLAQRDVEEWHDRLTRLDAAMSTELSSLGALPADGDWRNDPLQLGALANNYDRQRARRIRVAATQVIESARADLTRFPELVFASRVPEALLEGPELSKEEDALRAPIESPSSAPGMFGWIVFAICSVAIFFFTRSGLRSVKLKRMMEHMPTTSARGATYGLNELHGQVTLGDEQQPLNSPLSDKRCVYYHYKVTKKSGDRTTTITDETHHIPFWLDDGNAAIRVTPEQATFYTRHHKSKTAGSKTYSESAILLGEPLYVLGGAGMRDDNHACLEIGAQDDLPFVLSALPERELHYRIGRQGNLKLGVGITLAAALGMYTFTAFGTFGAGDYFYATATSLAYTTVCFIALMFNDLVFVRQRVRRAYANIEVALKKRFDLIQALLPAVKAYVAHEHETLQMIAALRTHAPASAPSEITLRQTNQDVAESNAASTRLFALREAHPHLQADAHITRLLDTLTDVEDELALMRSGYNDAVEHYNTRIATLPEFFISRTFGFEPMLLLDETIARVSDAPDIGILWEAPSRQTSPTH